VLAATQAVMDKARDAVEARLDSGELERMAEQTLATLGDSSGGAPVSPASTPPT
jgi:ribosomal protein L2